MTHRFQHASTVAAVVLAASLRLDAGPVCLEAEHATEVAAPMQVSEQPADTKGAAAASGGRYLEVLQGKGNPPNITTGRARLSFDIEEEGDHVLWCRVWWNDECSNSFTMGLDDAAPFAFGQDGTYNTWHWVKAPPRLKQLVLAKGKHTLLIENREDGVRIDQVLLTLDKKFVPVDIEPVTVAPPAAAEKKP